MRLRVLILVLVLVAGCGPGERGQATKSPVPPSHTPVPAAASPVPPTRTPVPAAASSLPSTHTPAPAAAALATPPPTPVRILEVREALDKLEAKGQLSGAVLIALDGVPILQTAYGQADRANGIPNEVDTRFNLGSMDKMFTGVAILQLVEQGKLALDDTIADHLPDYPNREVARAVTIHQLLTHTSGMGDYFESDRFEELRGQIRSVADYLPLFAGAPLEFTPGEQFRYSNSGYIVLGLLIEAASGQSYYDYVRLHIFEPSGMAGTAAFELEANVPDLARGYTRLDAELQETGEVRDNSFLLPGRGGPAGGGYSTVGDLFRFTQALLDHRLLSPESTELLLAPKVRMGEKAQYAYGFMDRGTGGERIVGHGGWAPGLCGLLNIYLDRGFTTIVLTNGDQDCLVADDAIKAALRLGNFQ